MGTSAKTKYTKNPYDDCCLPECLKKAEWLPVVLIYPPSKGKKAKPAQLYIKSFPVCHSHKVMARLGLDHLVSPRSWEKLCKQFVDQGMEKPDRKFTGIGFVRKDDATIAAEAQFLDPRKLS